MTLALAAPAAAHVHVLPSLLPSGAATTLAIELPSLRPGQRPTALAVSGQGLQQLSSRGVGRSGEETRWQVRVRVEAAPGPLELALVARYADGASVRVLQTLTVVPPATEPGSGPPLAPLAAGLAALVAGTLAFVYFKKKSRAAC